MRLCLESLKYLLSCSDILASMYRMPACPIFHSAQRIQVSSIPQYVDPIIPNLEVARFDRKTESLHDVVPDVSYELLSTSQDTKTASLQSMDRPSGILRYRILSLCLMAVNLIHVNTYKSFGTLYFTMHHATF